MNGHSDYVRFTPESGHQIADVRFLAFYVLCGWLPDCKDYI